MTETRAAHAPVGCALLKEEYRVLPGLDIWYIPDHITPDTESRLWARLYRDGTPLPTAATDAPVPDRHPPAATMAAVTREVHGRSAWIQLSSRRLQAHPSPLLNDTLIPACFPGWLSPIVAALNTDGVFHDTTHAAANHVLVNEYAPGTGIDAHTDGPVYDSTVATISLGGSVVYEVIKPRADGSCHGAVAAVASADAARAGGGAGTTKDDTIADGPKRDGTVVTMRIIQAPRSLLVTKGTAYTDYLHRIPHVARDTALSNATIDNWHLLPHALRTHIAQNDGCLERNLRVSLTVRDVVKVKKLLQLGRTR